MRQIEFVFKINAKMFIKYVCRKKMASEIEILQKKPKMDDKTPVTLIDSL